MSASPGQPQKVSASRGAAVALVLLYPLVVYGGLRFLDARSLGALLGGLLLVRLSAGLRSEAAEHWRAISLQLLPAAAVIALTLILNEGRYLLALPVLMSASLFWVFARSLSGPLTIVERMARIQDPDLTPEEARYCTSVTWVWCAFFLANGSIAGLLAIGGSLEWWTLYTGLISYALMGTLFAGEFCVRKIRFRRFGPGVFDRIALALIGPGEAQGRTAPPDPDSRPVESGAAPGIRWTESVEKGSVLAIRALVIVATTLGRPIVRGLMRGVAVYYVVADANLRKTSRRFHEQLGVSASLVAVYRNVLRFAFCASDRIFLLRGQHHLFRFERHGNEIIRRACEDGRGAIMIGAHFGSFEALRASAEDEDFPISIVSYTRNAEKSNRILEALDPELASRVIQVEPGAVGYMLEIRRRVKRGEIVALLGDRPTPGAETVEVDFLGAPARFPTGPFVIAAALGCPILLVFSIGRDPNVYELYCEYFADPIRLPRRERSRAARPYVQEYVKRLEHYVTLAPDNWFNFQEIWSDESTSDEIFTSNP